MTLLPARALLAIAAVVDIALVARTAPVAAKALAARHGLTPRHFETLLQDLVHATILKAYRGPRGGYALARERRRITLGDIVRAAARSAEVKTEGPAGTPGTEPAAPQAGTVGPKPKRRPRIVEQVIEPALAAASANFLAELDRITVADLCGRAEADALESGESLDFTI